MNKYQVVMPNGDILGISADRVVDEDGALNFYSGNDKVGEIKHWIGWSSASAAPAKANDQ